MTLNRFVLFPLIALTAAGIALAQEAPRAPVRATIETVSSDGATLAVRTRGGDERTVRLSDTANVTLIVPASLADVKPGAFIGVAALPGQDGSLKAMEVHIFPESMRGAGEGHRPFDIGPGSTMTNRAISARVDASDGARLTVAYKGGEQTIVVDPKAPIVGFEPGARSDLKQGAAIIAFGPRAEDGSISAAYVLVGKDGLVPPL